MRHLLELMGINDILHVFECSNSVTSWFFIGIQSCSHTKLITASSKPPSHFFKKKRNSHYRRFWALLVKSRQRFPGHAVYYVLYQKLHRKYTMIEKYFIYPSNHCLISNRNIELLCIMYYTQKLHTKYIIIENISFT